MQKQTEAVRESCAGSPCKYYLNDACHKLPPTLAWSRDSALAVRLESYWPPVNDSDWCGEFAAADPKPAPPESAIDRGRQALERERAARRATLLGLDDSPLDALAKAAEAEHAVAAETLYRNELAKRRRAREGGANE